MRMTEDILKALQNCIHGVGSITEFSQQTNVTIDTLSKFLSRQSNIIRKETWAKLQPPLQPYLQKNHGFSLRGDACSEPPRRAIPASTRHLELDSNQKILLDAFGELTRELQERMLLEIVELAKLEIRKKNEEMK